MVIIKDCGNKRGNSKGTNVLLFFRKSIPFCCTELHSGKSNGREKRKAMAERFGEF